MSDTKEQNTKNYIELSITSKPGSEIEVSGEVPVENVAGIRKKTLEGMRRELELPGFRKGKVPADVAEKHIGEQALMREVAERAIAAAYRDIVVDEKLDVVGRPAVTITKLAPGNPIGFKIMSAVFPEVSLPDYLKLAKEERKNHTDPEKEEVTEEDLNMELKRLQEMMAGIPQEGSEAPKESADKKDGDKAEEKKLPKIDDEFARTLGDFKDLADLKTKMSSQKLLDKKQKAYDKRRIAIADKILAKTKVEIPQIFIEGELDQMVADFTQRVQRAGMELDAYLKQSEKTVEQLRKEWQPDALKRAKLQITLAEIAKKEGVSYDKDKLARKVAHIKEHYPDAEESAIQAYMSAQMTNENVFALLEDRKPEEETESDHSETKE